MSYKTKYLVAVLFLAVVWGCESDLETAERKAREGEIPEAIKAYKLILQDKEGIEKADICSRIGQLYLLGKDTMEAIRWYGEAITDAPDQAAPYIKLGKVYSEKDEVDSALFYYRKALELTADKEAREEIGSWIEECEFRKARKAKTLQGWIDFKNNYPHSKHNAVVDSLAFPIVKSKPTLTKVDKFIKEFPESEYIPEAKRIRRHLEKIIIAMKVNNIHKNVKAGVLPPPQATGAGVAGGKIEIRTTNDTEYRLTIYYAGPETLSVSFQPRETSTMKLAAGEYRVAAEVDKTTVIPFKGTNELKSGRRYTQVFWIERKFH